MEIPELIRQRLGDEELESAVKLGDEDLICFTPSRTLLYRGEGLLSDDSVESYDHAVERLDVSEGRRKTSFTLTYVDREERFAVARDHTEAVLERLLAGVLGTADVIQSGESIEGVFRFSELTLVITDRRVIKHVGSYLWDEDYEEFPYANVTGLDFEEGSVATYVVVSVDGRPQRIKAPRGDAELVRRALTAALFEYHDVDSLDQLNQTLGGDAPDATAGTTVSSDIELDDSIAPLVTPDEEDDVETLDGDDGVELSETADADRPGSGASDRETAETTFEQSDTREPGAGADDRETAEAAVEPDDSGEPTGERATAGQTPDAGRTVDTPDDTPAGEPAVDPEDIEAMKSRLATLTKVAKRQNRLLERQQETIDQLVEELRRRQ